LPEELRALYLIVKSGSWPRAFISRQAPSWYKGAVMMGSFWVRGKP
jgi:hypothetical protein